MHASSLSSSGVNDWQRAWHCAFSWKDTTKEQQGRPRKNMRHERGTTQWWSPRVCDGGFWTVVRFLRGNAIPLPPSRVHLTPLHWVSPHFNFFSLNVYLNLSSAWSRISNYGLGHGLQNHGICCMQFNKHIQASQNRTRSPLQLLFFVVRAWDEQLAQPLLGQPINAGMGEGGQPVNSPGIYMYTSLSLGQVLG